jgi:hypothetical protein
MALIIQGRPKHMRMSKVFEPILFDTAIEPLPCEEKIRSKLGRNLNSRVLTLDAVTNSIPSNTFDMELPLLKLVARALKV